MSLDQQQITIVGGGPVGALNAIFLSRRGYQVDLYEARSDIRKEENAAGRSINLALSVRGRSALKHAGIENQIAAIGIPMHSRYIHMTDGSSYTIPYGKRGQFLLSTDRLELNRQLLTAAENSKNVKLHFQHKLSKCNVKEPEATFTRADGSIVNTTGGVLCGCDGAYSAVRRQMMRGMMDYSQRYIEHGYKELSIPPSSTGEYKLPPHHLHIWPRREFMLIALPNQDKSFTCTLFMPFKMFDKLKTSDDVVQFFAKTFTDAVPLIGEELLRESFFILPPLPVVTVKCDPYHVNGTAVIMGDAAHAVVPFYGQGLNCGLEDALIFDSLMDEFHCDFAQVLPEFSKVRVKAGQAIADLSLYNYLEMRSHVASPWFLFRKKVDNLLHYLLPNQFIPKYTMVTFTRISYDEVVEKARKQDKMVSTGLFLLGLTISVSVVFVAWKLHDGGLKAPNFEHMQSLLTKWKDRVFL